MPSNSPIPSRRLLLRQSSLFLGGIALAGTDVLDLVESRRGYGI